MFVTSKLSACTHPTKKLMRTGAAMKRFLGSIDSGALTIKTYARKRSPLIYGFNMG
jgi:hypothetical protein